METGEYSKWFLEEWFSDGCLINISFLIQFKIVIEIFNYNVECDEIGVKIIVDFAFCPLDSNVLFKSKVTYC